MIEANGSLLKVSGSLTLDGATAIYEEGVTALTKCESGKPIVFDFSGVTELDSAALSVVFGWMRNALQAKKTVQISNPPTELLNLASVYGVSEVLPLHV